MPHTTTLTHKILLIDDEDRLRYLLARIIELEGYEVIQADNAAAARKKASLFDVDVIICDVKLPDANGVALCAELKARHPLAEIILLTAYGNIPDSVQAIRNGAFDYITKGDDNNKIIPLLQRAVEKVTLARRVLQLEQQVGQKYSFENVIGQSASIRKVIELAQKVAATDTAVLLLGETGTGKEVFAQAIHQASQRRNKPFVAINCAAFSKELLESELFGHKAGAFTGAIKDKKGLFEEAHTGTIFLDEIGEMALELQAKLLRVLESGEFIRIGETQPRKVDVRLISATNRDLQHELEGNNFRSDLFYRLSVFQIQLPPLRERIEDIRLLTRYFMQQFALKMNKKIRSASPEFVHVLEQQHWQGNIRELKNIIERSVILADTDILTVDTLPYQMQVGSEAEPGASSSLSLAIAEKIHIQKVLSYTKGNKTEAARLLQIGLTTLYRKIDEFHLDG